MRPPRYDAGSIALHWLHAALILTLLGLGLTMTDLPKGAERSAAISLHKSLGILALLLFGLRLAWRLTHHPPTDPRLTPWQHGMARMGHRLLYLLLLLTPLSGYLSSSFTPYPMRVFGLSIPKAGYPDETLNALFGTAHSVLTWTLMAVLVAHVAAVILHQRQGVPVLTRMLPGRGPDR